MTLQVYQQPKLTCFHQSVTKSSYGSISLTYQWAQYWSIQLQREQLRPVPTLRFTQAMSLASSLIIMWTKTWHNFIFWSTSQVNFFYFAERSFTKYYNLSKSYCCRSGGNFPKILVDSRIDESLHFSVHMVTLRKNSWIAFEPFAGIVCLLAQSTKV